MKDRDAINFKLVDRFDERTKDVGGDAGAGITHDVDIADFEAKDRQRIDAAIHAGDHSEVLSWNCRKRGIGERRDVRAVSIGKVSE